MSLQKKVSIITISYNAEDTIERTIKSVLSQDYENIEYIIIDGASNDGTMNVVKSYSNRISTIISEEDSGLYDAMNKGIRHATGEIIALLNADDYYSSEHVISDVMHAFESEDAEIVYGDALYVNWNNTGKNYVFCEGEPLENLWWEMVIPHPAMFVKKDVYERIGFFDLKYKSAADYDFTLRCYASGVKFNKINEVLVNFAYGGISTQDYMTSAIETIKIATGHLDKAPNAEEVLKKNLVRLQQALAQQKKCDVKQFLADVGRNADNVVVFGVGRWGKQIITILNNANIKVSFCVDSDEGKWGTCIEGHEIRAPYSLREFEGVVVIAAKHAEKQIEEFIRELDNKKIVVIKGSQILT